jgi:hypothetical protein
MKQRGAYQVRYLLSGILVGLGIIFVGIIVPTWIHSINQVVEPNRTISPADAERNATKLAIYATSQAHPTSQIGVKEIKPLDDAETERTPEATAYAPIRESRAAGVGAIVEVQPPFAPGLYRILNAWYYDEKNGQQRTFVWAGSLNRQGEAEPGIVIVQVYQLGSDAGAPQTELFNAPEGVGPLSVVGAEGLRLILHSAEDKTIYFDVSTKSFVVP